MMEPARTPSLTDRILFVGAPDKRISLNVPRGGAGSARHREIWKSSGQFSGRLLRAHIRADAGGRGFELSQALGGDRHALTGPGLKMQVLLSCPLTGPTQGRLRRQNPGAEAVILYVGE